MYGFALIAVGVFFLWLAIPYWTVVSRLDRHGVAVVGEVLRIDRDADLDVFSAVDLKVVFHTLDGREVVQYFGVPEADGPYFVGQAIRLKYDPKKINRTRFDEPLPFSARLLPSVYGAAGVAAIVAGIAIVVTHFLR
ncbi:DUF3592 domain-containing protein [Nocardia jiangxiensis]|uniref:DUF3592 domain-containing protein n=1 Tax=Nocardia jiangxiensis TaxID=282685 RepID=UPI00059469C9|nr:DUF3592 domain-containing protein [Nocardia jiangxiensis]